MKFYTSQKGGYTSTQTGAAYHSGVSGPELAMKIDYGQNTTFYNDVLITRALSGTGAGLKLYDPDGDNWTRLIAVAQTANLTLTLPPAYAASGGYQLASTDAGVMTWASESSSLRYKENIRPLEIDSSKILELEPKSFNLKEGHISTLPGTFGYIAEEVEKVLPELVQYDKEGRPDALMYPLLTVLLIEEVKKLRSMITEE